ncbi:hypothetical protein BIV57_13380 [Mangrovactinospora gilvigrisea]|uniref:Type II secretion system protein GspF domain-containing protein n=1 Tax=Mangrovactinospora gilvigrisea TaxID=1428644 RepID=A0A1J7BU56_9ACTN|nr:type II secretion system F family protein [Mangrovactinospora gilvigrisea]OIV36977.1 hypothetical protein BIV57_13380 [Mangrovactinospora gilvigrisea]
MGWSVPAMVTGALVGLGLLVVLRELLPSRPDVGDVLARLDASAQHSGTIAAARPGPQTAAGMLDKIGLVVLAHTGLRVRVPDRDLKLLGRTPERHLGTQVAAGLYGLLLPLLGNAVLTVAGLSLGWSVPGFVAVGLAVLFYFIPDLSARGQASEGRNDFRYAIAAFLELVALERAADAGPAQALERASNAGDSWVFARIRETLSQATLQGVHPWRALQHLAEELALPELRDAADIVSLAGDDGAAVQQTLHAQARSLRVATAAQEETEANRASEKMIFPVTMLVLLMTVYIGYPVANALIHS